MPDAPEPMAPLEGKIFGVGLARTGTTSLYRAMGVLGIDAAPSSAVLLEHLDLDFLRRHDAFFDNPVPFRYRRLASLCPDARWIVTQRPLDLWLESMEWLFGPGLDRLDPTTRELGDRVHLDVYGTTTFDARLLTEVYERHYDSLADWVPARPHVWLDTDEGLAWGPICELLDKPVPRRPFPHENRRKRHRRR